jgi:hypothetical protein
MFPLHVKTTSCTNHVLYFATEADRDAFVVDNIKGENAIMLAGGYDLDAIR